MNQEEGGAASTVNSADIRGGEGRGSAGNAEQTGGGGCEGLSSGPPWDIPTDRLVSSSAAHHSACNRASLL